MTGKTAEPERRRLFDAFRRGEVRLLVLSRVGNFALDLPDADLLIQVSGTFGSRQEEAQRLGGIRRPMADGRTAHFYTLVSRHTCEEDFALNRQRFLTEQGYTTGSSWTRRVEELSVCLSGSRKPGQPSRFANPCQAPEVKSTGRATAHPKSTLSPATSRLFGLCRFP
ncbi:MAG: hypothetical protein HY900_05590 [Deltaproteobacteria bacterium]|nr:hypothetical protein [Deltaproteobacteria bacterium]